MWWSSFGVGAVACVALVGCGDAGSGQGLGSGAYGYSSVDSPSGSMSEPPGSWNEPPGSFNEPAGCGTEQVVMMSDLVDALFLPVCAFVDECFEQVVQPSSPTPGGPQEDGVMYTRDGEVFPGQGMSPYCSALVENRIQAAEPGAGSSECLAYEAIAWVLKTNPVCDGAVVLGGGTCLSAVERCAADILRGGCVELASDRIPPSCAAFAEPDEGSGGTQPPDDQYNP